MQVIVDLTQAISPQAQAVRVDTALVIPVVYCQWCTSTRRLGLRRLSSQEIGKFPQPPRLIPGPIHSELKPSRAARIPHARSCQRLRVSGLSLSDIGGSSPLPGPASSCRLAPSAFSRPRIELLVYSSLVISARSSASRGQVDYDSAARYLFSSSTRRLRLSQGRTPGSFSILLRDDLTAHHPGSTCATYGGLLFPPPKSSRLHTWAMRSASSFEHLSPETDWVFIIPKRRVYTGCVILLTYCHYVTS
ncbi:hypothetical protein EDB83DRAFT_398907 [Lactarius deliciosus]|nr:hypothetical protein EDB83DRAFT_398907 [Lactarius deliciosus]